MARLADICPSSDDDLPDLKTLIRKQGTRVTRTAAPIPTSTSTKPAASKPIAKSETRRVRRLGEPSKATGNPLFQRWNSEEHESSQEGRSRGSGATGRVSRKTTPSESISPPPETGSASGSESEDDLPRAHVQRQRRRQPTIEDSDEDSDSQEETQTLLTRVRRLQKTKAAAGTAPLQETEKRVPRARPESKSKALMFAREIESGTDTEVNREESEAEETSVYRTAGEDSSDSASELDWLNDSPEQPIRTKPVRSVKVRPQGTAGAKDNGSIIKNAPSLKPKARTTQNTAKETASSKEVAQSRKTSQSKQRGDPQDTTTASDLADTLSKLRLQLQDFSDEEGKSSKRDQFTTPPSTPPKTSKPKGLMSPSKKVQIPKTPHRPSMDAFWNQDTVNEWNDHHSPRKLLLPPVTKSPSKASPKKDPKKETKKAFAARKHALAESFLAELDREITEGEIAKLAESTGGVKLVWTKTLNTTAGRASWRRETIRTTRKTDGAQLSVAYKHHASIELAEKVIDDEHRLLNVMAHEFCHLANFMISGITTNPHGREFKGWAARCSAKFGDRGIEVTTKHSYDIDFKYVWECSACGTEFKRHSKSIDPQRHRCGSCKGLLKQTKPTPRGGGATGGPSKYQIFVREQMAVVREENPGSPQKVVMKLIAEKWAKQGGGKTGGKGSSKGIDGVLEKMVDLTIEEK
ncbi:SprT-like domain-containing protein [Fusarium sp. LHS14.1]|nr:SprT-like domain-containing protein [Fusarium sp. LHS14.1]